MKKSEFDRLYLGCFVATEHENVLYERVERYFRETENMSMKASLEKSAELSQWRKTHGYSSIEIARAKWVFASQKITLDKGE